VTIFHTIAPCLISNSSPKILEKGITEPIIHIRSAKWYTDPDELDFARVQLETELKNIQASSIS